LIRRSIFLMRFSPSASDHSRDHGPDQLAVRPGAVDTTPPKNWPLEVSGKNDTWIRKQDEHGIHDATEQDLSDLLDFSCVRLSGLMLYTLSYLCQRRSSRPKSCRALHEDSNNNSNYVVDGSLPESGTVRSRGTSGQKTTIHFPPPLPPPPPLGPTGKVDSKIQDNEF